jgi:hypothetical protein
MTTETALCPDCLGDGGPDTDPCQTCHGEGIVPYVRHYTLEALGGRQLPPPGLLDLPENPTIHEATGLTKYLTEQMTRKS